jgi:hypothetical protein
VCGSGSGSSSSASAPSVRRRESTDLLIQINLAHGRSRGGRRSLRVAQSVAHSVGRSVGRSVGGRQLGIRRSRLSWCACTCDTDRDFLPIRYRAKFPAGGATHACGVPRRAEGRTDGRAGRPAGMVAGRR